MSVDEEKTKLLPAVANATVGTQLSGIYELDERIAFGGMGEVYRGHNIQTGDPVAIKIVLPELARDLTILSLFKKEASVLNHLAHDAIVRYHVFTIDAGIGRPYLAMEFVDGESLVDLMKHGPMSPENVRKLCARLASGLSAAHEAGIVHRDLSPDNIILPGGKVERAKIIDFGIARSATVGGETLIGGKFAGKYNYVSPEQLGLFGGEITEQSDIYSLGLVLVAALRAEPINMGGTQVEIVEKRREMPDLSEIDASIRPILEAMLQPDPKARPADMAAVVEMAQQAGQAKQATTSVAPSGAATAVPPPPDTIEQAAPVAVPLWEGAPNVAGEAATDAARMESTSPPARDTGAARDAGASENPDFVPHVRPAYLDAGQQSVPPAEQVRATSRPGRRLPGYVAAAALLAIAAGGTAYLGGLFGPADAPPQASSTPPPAGAILTPAAQEPEAASKPAPHESGQRGQPGGSDADKQAAVAPAVQPSPQVEPPPQETAASPAPNAQTEPEPVAAPAPAPALEAPLPPPADKQPASAGPSPEQEAAPPEVDTAQLQPPEKPKAAEAIDGVAERIAWLRGYTGGECFYATAMSATDKAIEIEGFGTDVEPFMELLAAFQERFNIEPEVGVRLIEPAQCVVTEFLRELPASKQMPSLTLDRTSVPNGTPVSGRLTGVDGRRTDLILVDHKGMAFNLNSRLAAEGNGAAFSIPIGLSAADQAAKKVVPQMIVALSSASGIKAAEFSTPTPATELFPKILAEMEGPGTEAAATAKYFRLGG
ncbi:serine/threonine-protein kinase [Arvimicrobium flavum]|uniref:serine/threonine-protein kinase n=1 Tax=Arvimicrobium flavum TaxID=3393320 RepID=UPI00237C43B6|nr:serine/threonine-protein kinase [Mesorhizobium shangrilense]